MKIIRFILFPFAFIYWLITSARNGFYKTGIFRASKFSVPVISVGNLSMGGTGKTPQIEYLIRLLKDNYNVATLSRGFGRKERGFILADKANATAEQIGDEPLQYLKKFKDEIHVAVDANRVTGIMDLCRLKPETEVILLDDAYQHRAVQPGLSLLLTSYAAPFYNDFIVPVGNLREARNGKKRADLIIVTKCPAFNQFDKNAIVKKIAPASHQKVFFSTINYGATFNLHTSEMLDMSVSQQIILVTGIAKATPLFDYLNKKHTILAHFEFNDHHNFKEAELTEIHNKFDKFATKNPVIITTEKDAMRLLKPSFLEFKVKYKWFYQSIEVEIDRAAEFNKEIKQYVEKNS